MNSISGVSAVAWNLGKSRIKPFLKTPLKSSSSQSVNCQVKHARSHGLTVFLLLWFSTNN
jgi:hypothetical protein